MPYVHIRITDENNTKEQKAELIKGATDLLSSVLEKDPSSTYVVIEEVPLNHWGVGGQSVEKLREKRNKGK